MYLLKKNREGLLYVKGFAVVALGYLVGFLGYFSLLGHLWNLFCFQDPLFGFVSLVLMSILLR
jgi:ABC-type multidrug transport system permease subunit